MILILQLRASRIALSEAFPGLDFLIVLLEFVDPASVRASSSRATKTRCRKLGYANVKVREYRQ